MAQHQVTNVIAMVRQGLPAEQIVDVLEFGDERNAEAVLEGLRQVEHLLDHRLRGVDAPAMHGTEWLKELLDMDVEQYDDSALPRQHTD